MNGLACQKALVDMFAECVAGLKPRKDKASLGLTLLAHIVPRPVRDDGRRPCFSEAG